MEFLNRRDLTRYELLSKNLVVSLANSESGKDEKYEGKLVNLSEKGILLSIGHPLIVNEKINFSYSLSNNRFISGLGRIIWVGKDHNEYLCGIDVINYKSDEDETVVRAFLSNESEMLKKVDRRSRNRRENTSDGINEKRKKTDRRATKPLLLKVLRYNRAKKLKDAQLYFYERVIESATGPTVRIKGRNLTNFASNNYLGLAERPECREAAIRAIEKYGVGSGSVRLFAGTMDIHHQLEEKLAKLKGAEDAIVYPSGYQANLGLASTLVGEDDNVIIDSKAHASIFDGCAITRANIRAFKHNDMQDLERKLKNIGRHASKVIMTDGVFSMDGDLCALDQIVELGHRYLATVMIDDAHSTGVMGRTGKGTAEHFNLVGEVDLTIGTLSKGLGGLGGFMSGSKNMIEFLKNTSRGYIFSSSLPPSICASVLKALEILENEPELHRSLVKNFTYLNQQVKQLGFETGATESAIIPVILGDENTAFFYTKELEKRDVLVNPVIYPAVRKRESRLRVSVMATHTRKQLDHFIEALAEIKKQAAN